MAERKFTSKMQKETAKYLKMGYSRTQIAKILGVHVSTICKGIKRHNLEVRHYSNYNYPEDIPVCLNCTRPSCSGWCNQIKSAL
jgi:IS30 family transposase